MLKRLRNSTDSDALARYDIKPQLFELTRAKRTRTLALLKELETSERKV